ncbi:MAG: hypothetical protein C1941_04115 [Prosthecochloris sp.]|nr:hypothetical protein [Prosthecochloris sp.]
MTLGGGCRITRCLPAFTGRGEKFFACFDRFRAIPPFSQFDFFHWLLATGYWLLATGYWLLATGYWLLATGYWLLARLLHQLSSP